MNSTKGKKLVKLDFSFNLAKNSHYPHSRDRGVI
tara:strand:+ start:471 stop:572 length:102 start_codon:yes stop_codon:yes gene_type:complete